MDDRIKKIQGGENMSLSGGQLSGGNSTTERAENDFYATNPIAISTNMMNTCLISIVTISIYFISCRLRLYYIY